MTGFMYLLDLLLGMGGGWGSVKLAYTFFEGIVVGRFKCKKWGDHQKKKFFINNALNIHQSLLKLHVPLGWVSPKEGIFFEVEIFFIFWRGFGGF